MRAKTSTSRYLSSQRGFSLVELSIVLIIVGLLVGTAATPISSSIKQARFKRTVAQLNNIHEVLTGHLIATGRLPCPLRFNAVQPDDATTTSPCLTQHGALPATALGLVGARSPGGGLLDEWGREYLYAVSLADHQQLGELKAPDWLTTGEPAAIGAENLSADLQLCRSVAANNCAAKNLIANQIVWVVHSRGENDNADGLESENADNDKVFTISGYSSNQQQPFDDQLIWASRSELVYWLLKANWLP